MFASITRRPDAHTTAAGGADSVPSASPRALPIVFGVYREATGPVFGSQVMGPLFWLAQQGCDVHLAAFIPVGHFLRPAARQLFQRLRQSVDTRLEGRATWLPAPPSRLHWDAYGKTLLAGWLRLRFGRRPVILHCRGSGMTQLALQIRQRRPELRVLFDCRGLAHAEYRYEHCGDGRPGAELEAECRQRYLIERDCARRADAVLSVSHAMARYLNEEFGVDPARMGVAPCCVDAEHFIRAAEQRDAARAELGFAGRFVVAYCGGLHAWQMPADCFRVFRLIQRLEPTAHFFALTTQPGTMQALALQHGLGSQDITVRRAPHEEVPRYLAAGDVGLLLRERSLVNEVASPVKFGEYLAAGLPVIMTEGIGDFSGLVSGQDLGLVFEPGITDGELTERLRTFLGRYRQDPGDYRVRCQQVAGQALSPQQNYPEIMALYARLAEGPGQ